MGRILHAVGDLPAPYALIDQRIIDLEPGGHVLVRASECFKAVVILAGRFTVRSDAASLSVQPGDVLFTPCKEDYRYHPLKADQPSQLHVIRILWNPRFLKAQPGKPIAAAGRTSAHQSARRVASSIPSIVALPLLQNPEGRQWTEHILDECTQDREGRSRMIHSLLEQFLVKLERYFAPSHAPNSAGAGDPRSAYIVARARELLNERLGEKWTLDALAWELRLSGEHLARVFKRETGATIFRELARLRVERARELLISTELRVAEIASRVGMPDPTIFGRTFRRVVGVPPSLFRIRTHGEMVFIPRQREATPDYREHPTPPHPRRSSSGGSRRHA